MAKRYDEQQLLDYIEGNLAPEQRDQVEQTLRDQPEMLAYVDAMAGDRKALSGLPEPDAPLWIMEEVHRHLERAMLLDGNAMEVEAGGHRQRSVVRRVFVVGSLAAMFLLTGLVVGYSLWGFGQTRTPGSNPIVAQDDASQPPDVVADDAEASSSNVEVAMSTESAKLDDASRVVSTVVDVVPEPVVRSKTGVASAPGPSVAVISKGGLSAEPQSVPDDAVLAADVEAVDIVQPDEGPATDIPLLGKASSIPGGVRVHSFAPVPKYQRTSPMQRAEQILAESAASRPDGPIDSVWQVNSLSQQPQIDLTAPRELPNMEIVVQTEDLPRSVAQLNWVAGRNRAQVHELPDHSAIMAKARLKVTRRRYAITVPQEQVMELVRHLKEPAAGQRAFFNTIERTTTTTVTTQRVYIANSLVGGNAWPRKAPNYSQIIGEQLPLPSRNTLPGIQTQLGAPSLAPTIPSAKSVVVPVVLEQVVDRLEPRSAESSQANTSADRNLSESEQPSTDTSQDSDDADR